LIIKIKSISKMYILINLLIMSEDKEYGRIIKKIYRFE